MKNKFVIAMFYKDEKTIIITIFAKYPNRVATLEFQKKISVFP